MKSVEWICSIISSYYWSGKVDASMAWNIIVVGYQNACLTNINLQESNISTASPQCSIHQCTQPDCL